MTNLSWILFITNSFFTFVCMTICIEIGFSIFKIKSYRCKFLVRTFPLLNLILANQINFGAFFNPLQCNSCVQTIFFQFNEGLQTTLSEQQISLLRYSASFLPGFPFAALKYGFIAMSVLILTFKLLQTVINARRLKNLIKRGTLYRNVIQNKALNTTINKNGIQIFLSNDICSPMAIFNKNILFPAILMKQITLEEFEAILAHELEHLLWKDTALNCLIEITSAIFWWIPMKWWCKRMDLEQEMACDSAVKKYALEKSIMASGLVKSVKMQKGYSYEFALSCKLASRSSTIPHRVNAILNRATFTRRVALEVLLLNIIIFTSLICMII